MFFSGQTRPSADRSESLFKGVKELVQRRSDIVTFLHLLKKRKERGSAATHYSNGKPFLFLFSHAWNSLVRLELNTTNKNQRRKKTSATNQEFTLKNCTTTCPPYHTSLSMIMCSSQWLSVKRSFELGIRIRALHCSTVFVGELKKLRRAPVWGWHGGNGVFFST